MKGKKYDFSRRCRLADKQQNLILAVLGLCFVCFYSSLTFANASFDQQLATIQNSEDKHQALNLVEQLAQASQLSSSQSYALVYEKALIYYRLGELGQAKQIMVKALTIASNNYLPRQQAEAEKMIGVFHYFKGENAQALQRYQNSLNYYQSIDEPIKQANLLNNIGLVYGAMGDIKNALLQFELAEPLYQKFGSIEDKNDVRHNIATLYLRLKRFDIAIDIFNEVIDKRIELNDHNGAAEVYGNLGTTYKQAGQYELAQEYLLKSLDYYQAHDDSYNSASQLHNLAELHNQLSQPNIALAYAEQAIALAKKVEHKIAYAGALYSLAKAQFHLGKYQQASENLARSDQASFEMSYRDQLIENLALFALIHTALGDNSQALSAHNTYIQESNKVANEALNEQLAKYDSKQLKQQVEQLQQQKKLQQLEVAQVDQRRNFIVISVLLLFLSAFFIFRRNAERHLKEALKLKVRQRTKELEDLMEDLQKANQVKSQFLANMSHEIRTPLTAVIGQAEAIVHGDVPEEYLLEEVEVIHDNSVHLLELINDTLDLSKIEANKLELNVTSTDLHQVIRQLEQMFFERTTAKGLSFEIVHSLPKPFVVSTDHFRLKQVLINLCSNAVKFTAKGKVMISIGLVDKKLVFKVIDTGIGLDKQQLSKIFQSFTQADSSIARKFGGSGLGLSLSEKLIKLMHGKIHVQSIKNQGSVFTVTIPCIQDEKSDSDNHLMVSEHHNIEPSALKGKILIAEDHVDNRRLIARLLSKLGLEVIAAENGREAVELCRKHQPDLLLLDIQMPEMDGIEAYTVLREQGYKQPILAITANAMSHEIAHYLAIGFNGHLKKPLERKVFINTIAKYFDVKQPLDELENRLEHVDISDLKAQFILGLEKDQVQMKQALTDNNLLMLAELAHRLAGAAQMFGFANISKYALALEHSIKNNGIEEIALSSEVLFSEISAQL